MKIQFMAILICCFNSSLFGQCTVTLSSSATSICSGQQVIISATTQNCSANRTFLWNTGHTSSSIAVNPVNTGNSNVNIQYTVTVTHTGGTTVATKTITVKPYPNISISNNTSDLCDSSLTEILLTSNVVGATFQWSAIASNVSGAINGINDTIGQTLNNISSTNGTVKYIITPRNSGCNGTPDSTIVTVYHKPSVTITNNDTSICSGQSSSIYFSSNTTGSTFQWTFSALDANGAYAGTNDSIIQALSATTNGNGTVTYFVNATDHGCTGQQQTTTVSVKPLPLSFFSAVNPSICSDDSISISFISDPPGAAFSFIDAPTNVSGSFSGTGNSIVQQLTATSYSGFVAYTISPTLNGCMGLPANDTVFVTQAPALSAGSGNSSICSGSSPNIPLNSIPAGATFYWSPLTSNISGASPGNGSLINQTLFNSGIIPDSVIYCITATLAGCVSDTLQTSVVVKPLPLLTCAPDYSVICSGTSTNILLNSIPAGASMTWVCNSDHISGYYNSGGNLIAQVLGNTGVTDSVIYTVTPTLNGCAGSSVTATVVVNPIPSVSITSSNNTICSGEQANISYTNPTVPGALLTWNIVMNNCSGAYAPVISPFAQTLVATSSVPGTAVYSIISSASGCTDTNQVTITVFPSPDSVSITCVDITCIKYPSFQLSGFPIGGNFTINGIAGSVFDPQQLGFGVHSISYAYTNGYSCSATVYDSIIVDACLAYDNVSPAQTESLLLYPNPSINKTLLSLSSKIAITGRLMVYNATGECVFEEINISLDMKEGYELETLKFDNGVYNVLFITGNKSYNKRLIVLNR